MHLEPYVARVAEQVQASAALGDDRTREIARSLAATAGPAVRLALLEALGAAADEITAALLDSPGEPSVTVRLDGDEVAVDVRHAAPAAAGDDRDDADVAATARISLRLSESLKADIDAAARAGVSVNTWLVRAASAAARDGWPGSHGGPWGGPWAGPFGRGRSGNGG